MLDVAEEAAHGAPALSARRTRIELDLDEAALHHCPDSLKRASRSSAAAAAGALSSRIRRWPSGKIEATINTECSAAVRAARAAGESCDAAGTEASICRTRHTRR